MAMADLSLSVIYYTCNRINGIFAEAVRASLLEAVIDRYPVVSVSHLPIEFGDRRVVIGDVEPSVYQVYQNIYLGCLKAETAYVAFAEDDTLYLPEHFDYRPKANVFAYNENRWVLTRTLSRNRRRFEASYYFRPRTQMAQGICSRQYMIDALEEKFTKYAQPPESTTAAKKAGWGEPGRYEKNLGLKPRNLERFAWTDRARPNVTVNHHQSLMGHRQIHEGDVIASSLAPWGEANALWRRLRAE